MNRIPPQGIGAVGPLLKERLQFPMGNRIHDEYSSGRDLKRDIRACVTKKKARINRQGCVGARKPSRKMLSNVKMGRHSFTISP